MKKHNFSAGPSILDESVIRDAAGAVLNYQGTGLSILEVSHRAKEFSATMEEARNLMKELLDVPRGTKCSSSVVVPACSLHRFL